MKKNNSSPGFTLIELLIATTILILIISGMTIALMQQQRLFNLTKESIGVDHTGRSVLDFLSTSIRNSSSRQGKNFSLKFINGDNACQNNTTNNGTVNSPPDCLTVYSWDISRGLEDEISGGIINTELPSTSTNIEIDTSASGSLVLKIPPQWFDDDNNFIGSNSGTQDILLGIRSRNNICNPNPSINCLASPGSCSECGVILRGEVNFLNKIVGGTFTFDNIDDLVEHNFFDSSQGEFNFQEFINSGKEVSGRTYGFVQTISSQAAEMSIVESKQFRVDPALRALEININEQGFQTIAGGEGSIQGGLAGPGIIDMQFVFNLQNPDGTITKVGFCDDSTGCSCNTITGPPYSDIQPDFSCTEVEGREQDIRSVDIMIVVKSQKKPQKLRGGEYDQIIPALGDVLERTVDNKSSFNEPEEGFIYRVHKTTVYPRNFAREDFG